MENDTSLDSPRFWNGNFQLFFFPTLKTSLSPCSCHVDDQIRVHLLCSLDQSMDYQIMEKISSAFACQTQIHKFEVDLNGHSWDVDFGPENFGLMNVRSFHLSNFSDISADILPGAFNMSSSTLKEFKMEDSIEVMEAGGNFTSETFNLSSSSRESQLNLSSPTDELFSEEFEMKDSTEFVRNNTVRSKAFYNLKSLQKIHLGTFLDNLS